MTVSQDSGDSRKATGLKIRYNGQKSKKTNAEALE